MSIKYISDLHLGHANVIRFDNRPFSGVEEMEATILGNWNRAVANGDTVYILGDFCWGKEPEWKRLLSRMNGHKVLIRGNHDLKSMSAELRNMFEDVKDYKEIRDEGRHVVLCHYPILLYKGSYNENCYMLCGHVHVTRENDFLRKWTDELKESRTEESHNCGNIVNVGCMMSYINYTPRTLTEIISSQQ